MSCSLVYNTLSLSVIYGVFFIVTGNIITSFAITNNDTNFVDLSKEDKWYYNNSNNATIMDGWKIKVVLSIKNQSLGFYFGFYSSEGSSSSSSSSNYSLSVVAFREGSSSSSSSHTVVWSFNECSISPMPENSSLELSSGAGFKLLGSNGSTICYLYDNTIQSSVKDNVVAMIVEGMRLNEKGNLIILGSGDEVRWQSFDRPQHTLLVGQNLNRAQFLTNGPWFARLTETSNLSVSTNTTDGQSLFCYYISLHAFSSANPYSGLQYLTEDDQGTEFAEYWGSSPKSYSLEFIQFFKLDSDGHLRTYRYDSRGKNATIIVDITIRECEMTSRDRYQLTPITERSIFDDSQKTFAAINSITTLSGCQQVCLQNCSCSTAIFSYENSAASGVCYISPGIFLNAPNPTNLSNSQKFVKVLNSNILAPTLPSRQRKKLVAIVSASAAGGLILTLMFLVCLVMSRKNRSISNAEDDLKHVLGMLLQFSYEELEIATEHFSETLGRGGFGSVFKGVLADGTMIAVKRLDKMSPGMREFLAEVETTGSIHHFNLVRLIGFCAEKSCRLLVYENMANGSLDNWIFNRDQTNCLDWQTRKKIILHLAKGLAYLHEDCRQKIIHLDIKPHNILLDEDFNAKVSDFGLSKLISRDESQVLIPMRGTPGYLAPELQRSIVTVKADVYSFGIVVLEIVCKRRNVDSSRSESSFYLLQMLQKKAEQDRLIEIVEDLDEDMQNKKEEVVRMIKIAAWCMQNDHTKRPRMSTVVKVLEGVMEVEPNIIYSFTHAMTSSPVANDHITVEPRASILSAPR